MPQVRGSDGATLRGRASLGLAAEGGRGAWAGAGQREGPVTACVKQRPAPSLPRARYLMILSGELGYRVSEKHRPRPRGLGPQALASSSSDFRNFLLVDCDIESQRAHFQLQREQLAALRHTLQKCHRSRVAHEGTTLKASVDAAVRSTLCFLDCSRYRLLRELENMQQQVDAEVMVEVQRYFAHVKDEMESARVKLDTEMAEFDAQRRQAKLLRDVRVFAHHLYHETRGKVVVSVLERDSAQFKRCKKAIKENISSQFMAATGFQCAKVMAVFKLENSLISDHLQKVASSIDDGKVKGLFFTVPKGGLEALCVYGLNANSLANGKRAAPGAMTFDDLFQAPWFRSVPDASAAAADDNLTPAHQPNKPRQSDAVNTGYSAETVVRESISSFTGTADGSIASAFQFSRQCTLSSLKALPTKELEEGVYISLCRVLVSKLRTTSNYPTLQDIKDALSAGYDAIYSTINDEYLLLKAEYILPEFVMLVNFGKQEDSHVPSLRQTLSNIWVPPALTAETPNQPSSSTTTATNMGEVLINSASRIVQQSSSITTSVMDERDSNRASVGSLAGKQAILANVEKIFRRARDNSRLLIEKSFS